MRSDSNPSDVTFSWTYNGIKSLSSYQYRNNGTLSVATITPRSSRDYGVYMCSSKNYIETKGNPCLFRIIPPGNDGGLPSNVPSRCVRCSFEEIDDEYHSRKEPIFTICSLPANESFVLVLSAFNREGTSKQIVMHTNENFIDDDGT
ncbi:ig-like domain-containing protein [Caerostris extrusa]|uniref:Ig-like domain-containing protein n=1 Tax=Caerostris extrusa TaxID=172846 RepID=A0AAV4MYJ2_CAEEX|nr:ig-like domain-containing protein [Caerostris extrusa]